VAKALRPQGHTPASVFRMHVTKPGGCADFAARITPTSRAIARRCRVIRLSQMSWLRRVSMDPP